MTPCESTPPQTDASEQLLRRMLDCYLALIMDVSEFMELIGPDFAAPHQEHLVRLRQRLAFQPSQATLDDCRETLRIELAAFAEKAREHSDRKGDDIGQIVVMLAQAGDAFAFRQDGYLDRLRHFSRQLETADGSALKRQVASLREVVEFLGRDHSLACQNIRRQLEEFQARLQSGEAVVTSDELTGLPNRVQLERQIDLRMASPKDFCLLTFHVERFHEINGRFGRLCAEEVLKQIAGALACQVRARDFVSRLGEDRFTILMECGSAQALPRGQQIAQWLSGHYRVETSGRESVVEVSLGMAMEEKVWGEAAAQMLERVDAPFTAIPIEIV